MAADEIIVVCKSCFNKQDPVKVMNSMWYQAGKLPPCRCGGPTMEMLEKDYDKFVEDSKRGKFFR